MTRSRILADYVSTGVTSAELDQLDTTSGTPGSGNFLRGDKTWQTVGSDILYTTLDPNATSVDMNGYFDDSVYIGSKISIIRSGGTNARIRGIIWGR